MTRSVRSFAVVACALAVGIPLLAQRGPAPEPTRLSPDVLALACAPRLIFEKPSAPLRVTGGQDSATRVAFAPGDLITINAGTDNGIDVGQQYYVRRAQPNMRGSISRDNPATIRTAGWIRIYAVDRTMSLATITHACDSVETDDYLEPFSLPDVPVAASRTIEPQRSNYGRVIVGQDRRRAFGINDFFIVDRGSDHGVAVGAQFVIYRDRDEPRNFLFELGEAVAVEVRPESSTLQVTLSRDAFLEGDLVALRK